MLSSCFTHGSRPVGSSGQHSTAELLAPALGSNAQLPGLINFQPFKVMNGYKFPSFAYHSSAIRLESHPAEPWAEPRAAFLPCSPTPTCLSPTPSTAHGAAGDASLRFFLSQLKQCPSASVSLL